MLKDCNFRISMYEYRKWNLFGKLHLKSESILLKICKLFSDIKCFCFFFKFLGISILGLCLELFSYTVMMSYNYTNSYDFLSYMEYPILLLQEYALIYFAFKYQNLLGLRTQVVAVLYVIIATLIYLKLFPLVILQFLVVSTRKTTFFQIIS